MSKNNIKNEKIFIFILFVFIYISMALGYFFSYGARVLPDGAAHLGYVFDVMKKGYPDYINGEIYGVDKYNYLNHPPLYYLLSGYLARFFFSGFDPVVVARLINLLIGVGIIATTYKILRNLNVSQWAAFSGLSVFLFTPMFLELSVAVNNDLLSIFGSTLLLLALVSFGDDIERNKSLVSLFFIGGAITALTKATGVVAILTFSIFHILYNWNLWLKSFKSMKMSQWFAPMVAIIIVGGYYIFTFSYFGKLFPAPQGNPADYYLVMHPNSPRWGLIENLQSFYAGNSFTFTKPYGHQEFKDTNVRYLVLNYTLLFFIFVFLLFLILNFKNKMKVWSWMVPGFALFICIYFCTLRLMHLQTGYQGAFQARYAYSYLPVFAVWIAISYDYAKFKFIRLVMLGLIAVNIVLGFQPAWGSGRLFSIFVEQSQPVSSANFGELIKGREFEQTFVAEGKTLGKVSMFFATFARVNHSSLQFEVISTEGDLLFQKKIDSSNLVDNSWFEIKTNLHNLMIGHSYTLKLISPDGAVGNAVTWLGFNQTAEDPHYINTKYGPALQKGYGKGEAIVDGQHLGKSDFTFKLYFR